MTFWQKSGAQAVLGLLAARLLWLIVRARSRGVVRLDLFVVDNLPFPDVPVRRATMPLVYWLGAALVLILCMRLLLTA